MIYRIKEVAQLRRFIDYNLGLHIGPSTVYTNYSPTYNTRRQGSVMLYVVCSRRQLFTFVEVGLTFAGMRSRP